MEKEYLGLASKIQNKKKNMKLIIFLISISIIFLISFFLADILFNKSIFFERISNFFY